MIAKCLDCAYCQTDPANIQQGVCLFNPPVPVVVGMTPKGPAIAGVRPTVALNGPGCSNHKTQIITTATPGTIQFKKP